MLEGTEDEETSPLTIAYEKRISAGPSESFAETYPGGSGGPGHPADPVRRVHRLLPDRRSEGGTGGTCVVRKLGGQPCGKISCGGVQR